MPRKPRRRDTPDPSASVYFRIGNPFLGHDEWRFVNELAMVAAALEASDGLACFNRVELRRPFGIEWQLCLVYGHTRDEGDPVCLLTLCEEMAEQIAATLDEGRVFRLAVDFTQADVDDQVRLLHSPTANKRQAKAKAPGPKRRPVSGSHDASR